MRSNFNVVRVRNQLEFVVLQVEKYDVQFRQQYAMLCYIPFHSIPRGSTRLVHIIIQFVASYTMGAPKQTLFITEFGQNPFLRFRQLLL